MFSASATNTAIIAGAVSARRPGLLKSVTNMVQLSKERRALAALDADTLADIGISRSDAMAEASRTAWDAPDYWHN